jgi:predicted porin
MGLRWDDSIKYEANFNGVTVGAMATLGGIPNEFLYNSMFGASLGYNSKDLPVSGSIAIQGENDVNNNHHWDVGAGVKYALDATDGVYAFYIHSVFDSGFARIAYSDSEMGKAGAGTGFGRTDDIINVAVNYYIMPSLNLIAAYYWDNALNVNAAADDGSRDSILLVADYYFTKDFDVYLAGWYTIFNGALEYTIYGGDNAVPDGTGYQFNAPPTWATGNTPSAFTCELGVRFRF